MKKLFFIALFSVGFIFQGSVFGQSNPTGPTSLTNQKVSEVITETSQKTGITDSDLQESFVKGEMAIEETNDGYRVYLSADHGGGIVDICEENF